MTINKQAAIDAVKKHYRAHDNDLLELIAFDIERLPSAQPEPDWDYSEETKQITLIVPEDVYDSAETIFLSVGYDGAFGIRGMIYSAQPESAIPLKWIEAQIEWLKSLDNAFSTLTAVQISAMVNKWKDEQDGLHDQQTEGD